MVMSMLIQDLPGYWKYYCLIIFGYGYSFTVFRCVKLFTVVCEPWCMEFNYDHGRISMGQWLIQVHIMTLYSIY